MADEARRDRGREQRWRGILRRQASSGVSIRQFCRDHQLAESAFYFWRQELARRQRERRGSPAALVPVEVTPEAGGAAVGRTNGPFGIEIKLPGGWRVHLAGAVDRAALAEVLAAVADARAGEATEGQGC